MTSTLVRGDRYAHGLQGLKEADNLITHVAIVGDMSPSMTKHAEAFKKVYANQVQQLVTLSQSLNQETRATTYLFESTVKCVGFDQDVLRMPSIDDVYAPPRWGSTALLDATSRVLTDLQRTATMYGDHAFLIYVITDGLENDSHLVTPAKLKQQIGALPDNYTLAVFVPDQTAVYQAKQFGFPAGNISVWDTTSDVGIVDAGRTMRQATESFMTTRSTAQKSGQTFRGTTSLFSMDPATLNQGNLFKAGVTPVDPASFRLLNVARVNDGMQIRDFVEHHGQAYHLGIAYYELVKREEIQPQKQIAILENETGKVYTGEYARELLGLPGNAAVKVNPQHNDKYSVFVQSTSVNRKVVSGQRILVMP